MRNRTITGIGLVLWVFLVGGAAVQASTGLETDVNYAFYTYDEADVPDLGEFHGIMQDSRGIIWMWGSRGAAFYDGSRFRHLTEADGLPAEYCYKIREHPDGRMFIGTYRGLAIYDVAKDSLFVHPLTQPIGPARDMYFYHDAIFVGFDAGVYFLQGNCWHLIPIFIPRMEASGSMVNAITAGPTPSTVWLATENSGVVELDLEKTLAAFTLEDPDLQEEMLALGKEEFQKKHPGVLMEHGDHFFLSYSSVIQNFIQDRLLHSLQRQVAGRPADWERWPVYDVFQTRDGQRYAHALGGLFQVNDGDAEYYVPDEIERVKTIHGAGVTDAGDLYLLTDQGVFLCEADTIRQFSAASGLPGNTAQCFLQDRDGGYWFGQSAGELSRLATQAVRLFSGRDHILLNDLVRAIPRPEGGLMLGGPNGFSVYQKGRLKAALELSEGIRDYSYDRRGNLLIATDFSITLADFRAERGQTLKHFTKPTEGNIFAVQDAEGMVWVTIAGKLFRWDGYTLKEMKDLQIYSVYPTSLYAAPDTSLYIGTWVAIIKIHGNRKCIYHQIGIFKGDVSEQFDYSKPEGRQYRTKAYPPGTFNDNLASMCGDVGPDGANWFGTFNAGIVRIDGDSVRIWDSGDGMPGNQFTSLYKDLKGNLHFLGGNGVVLVDADGVRPLELNLPKRVQLNDLAIDDDGRYYFATTMGLLVIDGERQFVLDRGFGLDESWINSLAQTGDGEILAIQPNGVYSFYPEDLFATLPGEFNRPMIRSVHADGRLYPVTESIRLETGVRDFSVAFALPTYLNESRHQFSWKMEGLDAEFSTWKDSRQASFERVPPGRYTFHLRVVDGLGKQSNLAAPISIVVPPHFYETTVFRILAAMLVLAGIAAVYSWRMYQAKLTNLRLEAMVKQRTAELEQAMTKLEESKKWEIESERLRAVQKIAASVAHEFNNPLTVVQGVFDIKGKQLQNSSDDATGKMLEMVPRHLERMKDLVRKLTSITRLQEMEYTEDISIFDIHASSEAKRENGEAGAAAGEERPKRNDSVPPD